MKRILVVFLILSTFYDQNLVACAPISTPSLITYTVSGTNLLINWESTNVWACDGYSIEVEFACQNKAFSGTGPFYTSAVISKTVVTPMAYPQQTIALTTFCPGQIYRFRAREVLGALPSQWTSIYTFTTPGVAAPAVLLVTALSTNSCSTGPAQLSASLSGCGSNNAVFSWQPTVGLSCTNCANPVANPTITTTYVCTTGQLTCDNALAAIQILASSSTYTGAIVSAPTAVCSGAGVQFSLQTAPSLPYQWETAPNSTGNWNSTGVNSVPVATLTASTGNSCFRVRAPGCETYFTTNTVCLTVFPTPSLTITGPTLVCDGETFTLTAGGAATYSWNGGPAGAQLVTQQSVTSVYSLTGFDANNCSSIAYHTVTLEECENPGTGTAIHFEEATKNSALSIFPNPNKGNFTIHCACEEVQLYEATGRLLKEIQTTGEYAQLSGLTPGIYFISVPQNRRWQRIVVTP